MSAAIVQLRRPRIVVVALLLLLGSLVVAVPSAVAASSTVVISQVFGGGGNSGAPYRNDFVELFNRGSTAASLDGWSIQYASATGNGTFANNPVTALSGILQPGQYYLVQMASGGGNGTSLPTPDAVGTVSMSATGAKVILVNTTSGLDCNGGSVPCTPDQLDKIVDLIGWGGANFFEGTVGPTTGSTTAVLRGVDGHRETDDNGADFSVEEPNPRNTAHARNLDLPSVSIAAPAADEVLTGAATTISGLASDQGGSVAAITVKIRRSGDGLYWTGSVWSPDEIWLDADGTTDWTFEWTFDPASQDGSPGYAISVRATDDVGHSSTANVVGMSVDNTPPTGAALAIHGGASHTNVRDVSLSPTAVGAVEMRFRNFGDAIWTDWEPYATARDWTLADGDGPKTVCAQFRDEVGNVAETEADITLDTAPPTGAALAVNGGAAFTNKRKVRLAPFADGAVEMRFQNSVDAIWTDWEPYASARDWTLPGGDGPKTVCVQFRDAAGNVVEAKAGITVDTKRPRLVGTKAVSVRRGAKATLRYKIKDPAPSSGKATVRIVIRKVGGKAVKTVKLKGRPVGKSLKYRFVCKLRKGRYRYIVSATDAAGNRQTRVARNTLRVR
ncbi:MAG: lamin tail domain-containing protein [Actinomycetales bacterium]|nr:lamin tail domain-containing protein [Actinomycetales bacterium]